MCNSIAAEESVFFKKWTWDDCSRDVTAGAISAYGRNITDMAVASVGGEAGSNHRFGAFRIADNLTDCMVNVKAGDFMLVAFDGTQKRVVSLVEYLANLKTYNPGRGRKVENVIISPDRVITLRHQVSLLPSSSKFFLECRPYAEDQGLFIMGNTQASTPKLAGPPLLWQTFGAVHGGSEHCYVVEETKWGGAEGLRTQEERGEERAAALAAGKATSAKIGPKVEPESLAMQFLLQIPLETKKQTRAFPAAFGSMSKSKSKKERRRFATRGGGDYRSAPAAEESDDECCEDVFERRTYRSLECAAAAPPPLREVARAGRVSIDPEPRKAVPLLDLEGKNVDKTVNLTCTITNVVVYPEDCTAEEFKLAARQAIDLLRTRYDAYKARTDLEEERKAAAAAEDAAAAEGAASASAGFGLSLDPGLPLSATVLDEDPKAPVPLQWNDLAVV